MIIYRDSPEGLAPEDVRGFFVGWPNPPTPETHLRILTGSALVELAIDDATNHVVGFATALSDGTLYAAISLLEVLPAYQGQGIGTALMQRLLERLRHLYAVDLLCDPDMQPFYRRLGMLKADGMMIRNYGRQDGWQALSAAKEEA